MKVTYDEIGVNYSLNRKSDPRIAQQINDQLKDATRIINIGAGTGSYEPENVALIAVEPSIEMIAQRKKGAHPALQGFAENLPFESNSFSHALTILSMHHWSNREKAFKEINRVVNGKFVAVSWNPYAEPFWLTRDYFPEIQEMDKKIFPTIKEFEAHFDEVVISPMLIPEDCQDGFLAAYWKRPAAYLDEKLRQSISTFAKMKDCSQGLTKLSDDLKSGAWMENNKSILNASMLDVGYIIVTAKTRHGGNY